MEEETSVIVSAPIPDFNSNVFINAYQNTRENGDMRRMISINPTNNTGITISKDVNTTPAPVTFIINNEYLIDTRRSYIAVSFTSSMEGSTTSLLNLLAWSNAIYPGGTTTTANIAPYLIYMSGRNKETLLNNKFNTSLNLVTKATTVCFPLYAINALFSGDYYYALLLNGVTSLTLNFKEIVKPTAASSMSIKLVIATLGNNKMYDYLRGSLLAGGTLNSKMYQTDTYSGSIDTSTILAFYHPSIIAIAIYAPDFKNQNIVLSIGTSAKQYYVNESTFEELQYLSATECPYTPAALAPNFICFPLYNFDHSDFTGVNCENVPIQLSTSTSIANCEIVIIYNTVASYAPSQNLIISDNIISLI